MKMKSCHLLAMTLVLLALLLPAGVMAAGTLDPAHLVGGSYIIRQEGPDVILEDGAKNFCVLSPSTEIAVVNDTLALTVNADVTIDRIYVIGRLTLTVNADATVNSIEVIGPELIIGGTGTLSTLNGVKSTGLLSVACTLNNTGSGIYASGFITVTGTLSSNDSKSIGIYSTNLTIDGGTVIANGNSEFGVQTWGSIAIKNAGTLTANNNRDIGILMQGGNITIDDGSSLTAQGNASSGVMAVGSVIITDGELMGQCDVSRQCAVYGGNIIVGAKGKLTGISKDDVGVYASNIEVDGQLTGTSKEDTYDTSGVSANGYVNVSGELTGNGNSGVIASGNIEVNATGTLTGNGYSVDGVVSLNGDIKVSGVLTGNGNNGVVAAGDIEVSGMGTLTGNGRNLTGVVSVNGDINVSGKLTGVGNIYVVIADGSISATGAGTTIKGIAKTRGSNADDTASVYATYGTLSAQKGAVIWEDYTATPEKFDDQTPNAPYKRGANIANIANYTWTPSLIVSGSGLLATRNYVGTQSIMGTRKGNRTGERVSLDADSTHKITFTGTLSKPVAITGITIDQGNATLKVGESKAYTATVSSADYTTTNAVTWMSDKPDVATVVGGKVTAVSVGTATITATIIDGDNEGAVHTDTVMVTVTEAPPEEPPEAFNIGIKVLAVETGKTLELPILTGYTGTWATGDQTIAKVDAKQKKVKALKLGETTLTYKVESVVSKKAIELNDRNLKAGDTYTIKFNVRKAGQLPTKIALDEKKLTLDTRENLVVKLTATVKPASALDKEVFWTSSRPSVATVDQDGHVTAVGPGTTKITAVSANLKRATITVTVLGAVTKVKLSAKKQTIKVGEAFELTAEVNDDALDKTIAWTSSKPGIATVENGVVTAIQKGKTTITAKAVNGKKASCVITVKK